MLEEGLDHRVGRGQALELPELCDLVPLAGSVGAGEGRHEEEPGPRSYAGRWRSTGEKVSVKLASAPFDRQLIAAFDLLVAAASPALPNPIALLELARGGRCLVSAWVQGQSLAQSECSGRAQILDGWIALAGGLACMHERGLWHGDPSLANVVLRDDGSMSWIDFGLLGHHGGGTPGFLAPETLQGKGGAPADLFGFSCLMGRMWTGQLPFASLGELAAWNSNQHLPKAWQHSDQALPEPLAKLLLAMLHPIAQERPKIQEVISELLQVRRTLLGVSQTRIDWRDPGRVPYLGSGLDRLVELWQDLGPQKALITVGGAAGRGRTRTLEEFAMHLQSKGHAVERIVVPDPALAASLLTAPWLDGHHPGRTFVVTGIEASTWIEQLGGEKAFEELSSLATTKVVMADAAGIKTAMPSRHDIELAPLDRASIERAISLFCPVGTSTAQGRNTKAWADYLHTQFEGRAGDTVNELRRIAAANATEPALWRLESSSQRALPAQDDWNVTRLCRANSGTAIDAQASRWQSWPVADQLALAMAWLRSDWEISPANARVLLSAMLAHGLSDAVLDLTDPKLLADPGVRFVMARCLQASAHPQKAAPWIEALIAEKDPTAQVAGLALKLRADIDAGTLRADDLKPPSALLSAQLWACAWWELWAAYGGLAQDPGAARSKLEKLGLRCAGLNLVERAPVLARAAQLLGNHAWERGHRAQAFAHYQACTKWFESGGESVGEAMAQGNIAALAFAGGELALALKTGERAIGALLALNAWQPLGALLTNHIRLLGLLDRTMRAKALHKVSLRGLDPQSVDAARVSLAIAQATNAPVTKACWQALEQLSIKAPKREILDVQIRMASRALGHKQDQELSRLVPFLSAVSYQEFPHLGIWAKALASEISKEPPDFRFWEAVLPRWEQLASSELPMIDLAWARRLSALRGKAPGWLAQRSGYQELLDRVLHGAPFADKAALRLRLGPAPEPSPVQPSATRHAPAFGGWDALLANLERWSMCEDLSLLHEALLDAALGWANAERGMLVLRTGEAQQVVAREFGSKVDGLATSRTIVESVFATGEGVVTLDARSDNRFGHAPSVNHLNLRSVLAAPLRGERGVFGVIYLDTRMRRGAFVEDHLAALEHFARMSSLLWRQTAKRLEVQAQLAAMQRERDEVQGRLAQRELEGLRMREHHRNLASGPANRYFGLLGASEKMRALTQRIDRYAGSAAPVSVVGEPGTGKKSVVKALHAAGCGEQAPLVMQDLRQLPEALAPDLLLGGNEATASLFELAAGGTLYLEGLEALGDGLQKKLLSFLEGQGESPKVPLARLIVGSCEPLSELVQRGELRQDLYYRLSVLTLEIPPLRQRLADLPELVQEWLNARGRQELSVSAAALRHLSRYAWPGNLRELEREVSRLAVLCETRIEKEDLSAWILAADRAGGQDPDDLKLKPRVEALEREVVALALERSQGNQSHAATLLGLSRFGLQKKLRRWAQDDHQEQGT